MLAVVSFQDGILPQPQYDGTRDATIREVEPDANFGDSPSLLADAEQGAGGPAVWSLIEWDTSSIAPGVLVNDVSISLNVTNTTRAPGFHLFELKTPWIEAEVTWNGPTLVNTWEDPGLTNSVDVGSTILGTMAPDVTGEFTLSLNTAGRAVVQRWLNEPRTNHGLLLTNINNSNSIAVDAREAGTPGRHPKLTIDFEAAATQPPRATLITPLDDGPADRDADADQVRVGLRDRFEIQLIDDALDDESVVPATVSMTRDGAIFAGFTFEFDAATDTIALASTEEFFAPGVYGILLSSGAEKISDTDGHEMPATTLQVEIDDSLPFQPTAEDDTYAGIEDTRLTIDRAAGVLANDDLANDLASVDVVELPTHGQLSLVSDGSFAYLPERDYFGTDSFAYRFLTPLFQSNVATVTIEVTAVNDSPRAVADIYATAPDFPLFVDADRGLLSNDTDVEADLLAASLVSSPDHGTLELNSDGSFAYVPDAGFLGTDSFTYVADDGQTTSEPATVLIEVQPLAPQAGDLVITELMYKPTNPTPAEVEAEFTSDSMFEFVELQNVSGTALDLTGVRLADGIEFVFAGGRLDADEFVVVVMNQAAFRARHGDDINVAGQFTGRLRDSDDRIELLGPQGETLVRFQYFDTWHPITDGGGFSLVINDPSAPADAWTDPAAWHASGLLGGSPGADERLAGNPPLLRVSEFMFNPQRPTLAEVAAGFEDLNSFEFIELVNIGDEAIHLEGIRFTQGIDFTFGDKVLAPAERVVVVADLAAFTLRYPAAIDVAGEYTGRLRNSGEAITLVDSTGTAILNFAYDDLWYTGTDGAGFSLVNVDPESDASGWSDVSAWRPSAVVGGSPGALDFDAGFRAGDIVINEVLTHTDGAVGDWIELYNTTQASIDLGGWYLSDDESNLLKYRIADGTTIGAGQYLVFTQVEHFGVDSTDRGVVVAFGLSELGDEAYLASAAGDVLTGFVVRAPFTAADKEVTFGRQVNSIGEVDYVALEAATLGNFNAPARVGPIVFRRIQYHPGPNDTGGDFVELTNISYEPVRLFNPDRPELRWRISGGIFFQFPSATTIAPGESFFVSALIPAEFRAAHGLSNSIKVFGPYGRRLSNDGEELLLQKPGTPEADGVVPSILVDRVVYGDDAPWPTEPDGGGPALGRRDVGAPGNDPANWLAMATDGWPDVIADAYEVAHETPLDVTADQGVLANDSDPDGDTLEAILRQLPQHGTLVLAGDGSFTYVPEAGYFGPDRFTYQVSDGELTSTLTAVTLTVLMPPNDPPVVIPEAYAVDEDTSLIVSAAEGVLANDTDPQDDSLFAKLSRAPLRGTLVLNVDGSFRYTPRANFHGIDSFTYRASDGRDFSTEATVTLTVRPINDPPVAVEDSYTVEPLRRLDIIAPGVLLNDLELDGDALTTDLIQDVDQGTLLFNSDGSFVYTAPATEGVFSFRYRSSDGQLDSNVVTVTLNVVKLNFPPIARDDRYSIEEDEPLVVAAATGVLANDIDANADPLTAVLVDGPDHGTLQLSPDGSFTYTPMGEFVGSDRFIYRAEDDRSRSSPATVTITVLPTNDSPEAFDDLYNLAVDTRLVVENAQASTDGLRIYQTNTLRASGGGGDLSISASQVVGARFFVDSPTRTSRLGGAIGGDRADGNGKLYGAIVALTGPDDFPDSIDLSTPDVVGHTLLSLGTDRLPALIDAPLTVNLSPGWYAIIIGSGQFGATGEAYTSDSGFERIEMIRSARRPWTTEASRRSHLFLDSAAVPPGVLANDTDVEGDPLTSRVVEPPTNGVLSLAGDGTFSYEPRPGFVGEDRFTYVAQDATDSSREATVRLLVGGTGTSVLFARDDSYTLEENGTLSTTVAEGLLANDVAQNATAHVVSGPRFGSLSLAGDGSFLYAPQEHFFGTDQFLYKLDNGAESSGPAVVTITINPLSSAPIAVDDVYTFSGGGTLRVGQGEIFAQAVYWTEQTQQGFKRSDLEGHRVETLFRKSDTAPLAIAVDPIGNSLFWPIRWQLFKSKTDGSETELLFFSEHVIDCNCRPGISDVALDLAREKVYWVTFGTSSTNGKIWRANLDGSDTEVVIEGKPWGIALDSTGERVFWSNSTAGTIHSSTLDPTVVQTIVTGERQPRGVALDIPRQRVYWLTGSEVRRANFDGTEVETILTVPTANLYKIALDPLHERMYFTDVNNLRIGVANLDGSQFEYFADHVAAHAVGIALGQTFGPGHLFSPRANDVDFDGDVLTATLLDGPSNGTLSFNSDSSFEYQPKLGFFGSDQFTYVLSDGEFNSNIATVTLNVVAGNLTPSAASDTYNIDEDGVLDIGAPDGVLANDDDGNGDDLTTILVRGPDHGALSLSADGSFQFTPDPDFFGADVFTYRASDGELRSPVTPVTIHVQAVNDAPVAIDDAYQVTPNVPLVINSSHKPTIGERIYQSTTQGVSGDNGGPRIDANRSVGAVFQVTELVRSARIGGEFGRHPFGTNGKIYAALIALSGPDDKPDSFDLSSPDVLAHTLLSIPDHEGSSLISSDFSLDLLPGWYALVFGTGQFGATGDGFAGSTGTGSFDLLYHNGNVWLFASNHREHFFLDSELAPPGVWANDRDVDQDEVSIRLDRSPQHGLLALNVDGTFVYTPDANFVGVDSFRYHVNDGLLDSNIATVILTIGDGRLPADLTGNGFVDFEDLTVLLANWSQNVSVAEGNLVNPGRTPVNFEDLTVLLAAWTGPGGAASPQAAVAEAIIQRETATAESRVVSDVDFNRLGRRDPMALRRANRTSGLSSHDAPLRRLQAVSVDRAMGEDFAVEREMIVRWRAQKGRRR